MSISMPWDGPDGLDIPSAKSKAEKPAPARKSRLGAVQRGRQPSALRLLFYGVEGVGKSTLAADAPEPIYLDLEDGTGQLDCARYPFRDGPGGHVAQSYEEVLAALDDLLESEHPFQTAVIDTIDRLEPLIWAHICERDSKRSSKRYSSIESYGYGKGYQIALDEWRALCHKLDALRTRRGMHVVMLGHAQIRTFKNPEGEDFDRYSLRIHEKSGGFLREWFDVIGFCCFEGGATKGPGDDAKAKAKGYSTGARLMRFERTAAYDAKTRLPLTETVELASARPWQPIGEAIALACNTQSVEELARLIDAELARLADEDLSAKVAETRQRTGDDRHTLIRMLTRLTRR